jgi:hypothetical protein
MRENAAGWTRPHYLTGGYMGKQKLKGILSIVASMLVAVTATTASFAAPTPTLNQTINNGVISTDILDATQVSVASPSFNMSAKSTSFTCQSGGSASTGTLGDNTQRVYVNNPGASNTGFTLTMAATAGPTASWTSGGNGFDFNDAGGSGCTDGTDTPDVTKAGQLTVDPAASTITPDCNSTCTTTGVVKGTSTAYVEGTTNSVTLINAGPTSDDIWRGYLTGAGLSQTIPASTPSGTYTLNMTITAAAQ